VTAAVPGFPALPDGLVARPLTPDDVAPVAGLLAAAEPVDRTGEHTSAEDLADFWVNDLVDLPRDGRAVCSPDGEVVGYATTIAPPTFRDAFGVHLEGRVHPGWRGRGVGRALLAWQLDRGAEIHAQRHPGASARLTVTAHTTMPSLEALLRRAGLEQLRWFFHMERPLAALPVVPPVDGVDLVPFSWDRDDEVRRAHNVAFVEHYGSSERDATSWEVMFTGQRAFRPDLSVLAVRDGSVVGYVLAYVYESDTAATGVRTTYFGQIGVLPQARGLGLAKAVIARALEVAAESDCQAAALEVDGENSSGAQRLYEGMGFATTHTQVSWSRRIAPLAAR
jgi:mycothiol synthase